MTRLSHAPLIHPSSNVDQSTLGRFTEVAEHCTLSECELGDYSYIMQYGMVWCATIGKFRQHRRLGAHQCHQPSDLAGNAPPLHLPRQRLLAGCRADAAFFGWRRENRVVIGHDVWIGHGATILPG